MLRNNLRVLERKVNHSSQSQSERCEKTAGGWIPALIVHRHRAAAFSQRSSSRGAFIRLAHFANAGVAPRQRNVSTFLKSGASVRRVASFLKSSASLRCLPRMSGGKFSI